MSMGSVEVFVDGHNVIGEGPVWCSEEQALYWVDLAGATVHRADLATGTLRTWSFTESVGCVIPCVRGGVLVTIGSRLYWTELGSDCVSLTCDPEPSLSSKGNRFNDGKCDGNGRLWVGTVDETETKPLGSLYRLSAEGQCERVLRGVICSNGLGWNPEESMMYYTDSGRRTIYRFEFDPDEGSLGRGCRFAVLDESDGVPDGLAVDAEGGVWSAVWDGWRVDRYLPDGTVARSLELPVARPTSCAFGGPNLTYLFVTSASLEAGNRVSDNGSHPGAIFVIDVGIPGLGVSAFAGPVGPGQSYTVPTSLGISLPGAE